MRIVDTMLSSARRLRDWFLPLFRRRCAEFATTWRRSLQLRVVTSTLALSAAVIFILGMLLQSQITQRLLTAKRSAAIDQTNASAEDLRNVLTTAGPGQENLQSEFTNAIDRLVAKAGAGTGASNEGASAGAFEPVISAPGIPAVGNYRDQVPEQIEAFVRQGGTATQIATLSKDGKSTTFLIVGTSLASPTSQIQLYLLFPLTSERNTIRIVQNTLLVAGLVLMLLLAGITNLVLRQVVRPVRQAAEISERFARGHFSERMRVVGEDDVARLGDSYNFMAESIAEQIRQLEEFGTLQRRFTSDVSHELRTPLTTVRMAADVLHASREQFPAGLARSTELLVDELDRFEALLGDLLEISRLDAGVEELATEPVDINGIARSAVSSVRGIAGATATEIVEDLPTVDSVVEVDARRVERILRNLLANAVDHGEGRPVRLIVRMNANAVALVVRDYGVGLGEGEDELVFNRFWRADPSRNRRTGGTGLGLAISAEDARLHGGLLEAWGRPQQGACFRLTIPRRPGATILPSPLELPPPESQDSDQAPVGAPADLSSNGDRHDA